MSSLTTLFVVGPDEYVEFNESMGSKAFLEHVWDQSRSPLKSEGEKWQGKLSHAGGSQHVYPETSASGTYLHSAGARVTTTPPPQIEFPVVLRIKGKGNTYKPTGKWISWQDLRRKNPLAVKEPPSLEEYMMRGGEVGKGEKIAAGAWLKGEKRFKVTKRKKDTPTVPESITAVDWVGGSSESIYASASSPPKTGSMPLMSDGGRSKDSIYATKEELIDLPSQDEDGWIGSKSPSPLGSKPRLLVKATNHCRDLAPQPLAHEDRPMAEAPSRQLRKSRSGLSLSERLGMDSLKEASQAEPMPTVDKTVNPEFPAGVQEAENRRGRPPNLELPTRLVGSAASSLRSSALQTPLSATHSPPDTPLKYIWRGENKREDLPTTPGSELAVHRATGLGANTRVGGLLLDAGEGASVLPQELQTPRRDTFAPVAMSEAAPSQKAAKGQIDQMLAKLRLARSGPSSSSAGTQESRWAVKGNEPSQKTVTEAESTNSPRDPPKAPRTLQESQKEASHAKSATKSLIDRLSAAPVSEEEAEKRLKSKKERKRGSRKSEVSRDVGCSEHVSKPAKSRSTSEGTDSEETPVLRQQEFMAPPREVLDAISNKSVQQSVGQKEKEQEKKKEEEPTKSIASSASAFSVTSALTTSSSLVGNDTLTSINWADDDDDLPDLPEDWTKAAQMKSASSPPPSSSAIEPRRSSATEEVLERSESTSNSATTKRGAKRGGKGRARKEKEPEKGSSQPPSAPQGLRIAGSAAKATSRPSGGVRELFPAQASNPSQSVSPPKGPSRANHNLPSGQQRETRPHGRPKLLTSNKDAFSRLTKGALSGGTTSNTVPPGGTSTRSRGQPSTASSGA